MTSPTVQIIIVATRANVTILCIEANAYVQYILFLCTLKGRMNMGVKQRRLKRRQARMEEFQQQVEASRQKRKERIAYFRNALQPLIEVGMQIKRRFWFTVLMLAGEVSQLKAIPKNVQMPSWSNRIMQLPLKKFGIISLVIAFGTGSVFGYKLWQTGSIIWAVCFFFSGMHLGFGIMDIYLAHLPPLSKEDQLWLRFVSMQMTLKSLQKSLHQLMHRLRLTHLCLVLVLLIMTG